MKAITIVEPWASLIAIGAKRIETRSWPTDYRGRVAIHASKKLTMDELETALDYEPIADALAQGHAHGASVAIWQGYAERQAGRVNTAFAHTRGNVIATATLAGCFRFTEATVAKIIERFGHNEIRFGDFTEGRYGFYLTDVIRLPVPIPATGALGLWEWEPPDMEVAA